jgi:hypothetical protein
MGGGPGTGGHASGGNPGTGGGAPGTGGSAGAGGTGGGAGVPGTGGSGSGGSGLGGSAGGGSGGAGGGPSASTCAPCAAGAGTTCACDSDCQQCLYVQGASNCNQTASFYRDACSCLRLECPSDCPATCNR